MNEHQKILIVDDLEVNLFALKRSLDDLGAVLVGATSGSEALRATLEHDFALALLDVQMPGMDGYELAELLRGDPKTANLPIIFLTANSQGDAEVFKGYEAGAIDYMVKPYDPAILRAKVKVFLQLDSQRLLLQHQSALLEAANRELEAFSYSVSHDLTAPLRGIDGFSGALLEDYHDKLDDTGKDYLERIRAGAQRMAGLIDDMLKLSRLTRAEMQLEEVDLGELAGKIIDDLVRQEPGRRVDFVNTVAMEATGDRALLEAALTNLLGNAWKFTAREARARIELGVTRRDGEKIFFVTDNGAGFDMTYADKLFGAFQRLHDVSDFPGTGVGLAIVKRVIHRHGGRVWAKGEVDGGATFYFTLPRAREQRERRAQGA